MLLLLLMLHFHPVLGGRVTGHLVVMVVVGIVHQIGDGNGDGDVARSVVVVQVVLRMHQMVRVMDQMVHHRIAADRVRRNGSARIVVAVALVVSIAICPSKIISL